MCDASVDGGLGQVQGVGRLVLSETAEVDQAQRCSLYWLQAGQNEQDLMRGPVLRILARFYANLVRRGGRADTSADR